MNMLQLEIVIIASITAIACALPGVFLVLRGVSLMSDAISHAILPGIVLIFLLVHSLESPLLLFGAALSGLLTVVCTELLINSQKLKKDAAIGLVFPLFFSVGVILISQYARDVHLDTDMVLLGELAFASLNRIFFFGVDVGSYALWLMSGILALNLLCVWLFFKELQVSAFDAVYSTVIACNPVALYYLLMGLTSITAVGAFDVVGAIVVVALMITPPATAFLCTERLPTMILLSCFFGVCAAMGGYWVAASADVSIAGSIAFMSGVQFIGALLFAPSKGLIGSWFLQKKQEQALAPAILCAYLSTRPQNARVKIDLIAVNLGWPLRRLNLSVYSAEAHGWVVMAESGVALTQKGYAYARKSAEKFCVFS
jgi:manganese/zinc/iron transport system permease protein